ncbi:27127_t:CDS:2 [Gigaspora margarita]|uniref:27127_t:CDS:1 n=1 Tax=Gigaspora margarita TaxID=4874 RepID=A0ABN7UG44_GIGMA|nr:27127_t:CDS:2 [Gigaspora margarita]
MSVPDHKELKHLSVPSQTASSNSTFNSESLLYLLLLTSVQDSKHSE